MSDGGRLRAQAADHPDQHLLRREPRGGAGARHQYLGRKWQSIDDHYHFSDGHLANVKGYEAYGKTAKTYAKLKDPANLKKATDFYVSIQIVGTPDDCLQQLGRAAADHRARAPGRRVLVRQPAAPRGRDQHAPVRRPRAADPAARPGLCDAQGHTRRGGWRCARRARTSSRRRNSPQRSLTARILPRAHSRL